MNTTPPPIPTHDKDTEHLRLLVIFHYIWAGLAGFCGCGGISLHYALMRCLFTLPAKPGQAQLPEELLAILPIFYVIPAMFMSVGITLNLLSAYFISRRQNRTFSIVVAGMNCLQVPFGLALGVFTLIVLLRDPVRATYAARR